MKDYYCSCSCQHLKGDYKGILYLCKTVEMIDKMLAAKNTIIIKFKKQNVSFIMYSMTAILKKKRTVKKQNFFFLYVLYEYGL